MRRKSKQYSEYNLDPVLESDGPIRLETERRSRMMAKSFERAEKTKAARTPEILAMQDAAINKKLVNAARVEELLKTISNLLALDLEKLKNSFLQICAKESFSSAFTSCENELKNYNDLYKKLSKLNAKSLNNYSEQIKNLLQTEFAKITVPSYYHKEYEAFVSTVLDAIETNGAEYGLAALDISKLTSFESKTRQQDKSLLLEKSFSPKPRFETIVKLNDAKALFDEELSKTSFKYMLLNSAKEVGVDETAKRFAADLQTFKDFNDEYMETMRKLNGNIATNFTNKLFDDLVKENAEFLRIAPIEMFKKDIAFIMSHCSDETKAIVQKRLEEKDMFNSSDGVNEQILKFFPDYINKINNGEDAIYCLKKDYTKYTQLNSKVKQDILTSPLLLYSLLTNVPQCMQYLSKQEWDRSYNSNNSGLGIAIYKYPQNLNCLPDNFFKYYSPKFIFTHYHPKSVLINKFKEAGLDISRFKELVKFLKIGIKPDDGLNV